MAFDPRGLLPILFLALGVGLLFYGIQVWLRARESRQWPVTPATILAANVELVGYLKGEDDFWVFQPAIVYRYDVAGRRYHGRHVQVDIQWGLTLPGMAERVAEDYPPGSEHLVAYDPRHPARSALRPGVHWVHALFPVAGTLFCLVAFLM